MSWYPRLGFAISRYLGKDGVISADYSVFEQKSDSFRGRMAPSFTRFNY